jgi:hypothetical protein
MPTSLGDLLPEVGQSGVGDARRHQTLTPACRQLATTGQLDCHELPEDIDRTRRVRTDKPCELGTAMGYISMIFSTKEKVLPISSRQGYVRPNFRRKDAKMAFIQPKPRNLCLGPKTIIAAPN